MLWADRITTKRTTQQSPYRLLYGQDCVLPFDIEEETWLTLPWRQNLKTDELLALRGKQLLTNAWIREGAGVKLDGSRMSNKRYYDQKRSVRSRSINTGEMVLLRDNRSTRKTEGKLKPKWMGPYIVADSPNKGVYELTELDGTKMRGAISGNRIKRYYAPIATATIGSR